MSVAAVVFHGAGKLENDHELMNLMTRVNNHLFLNYIHKLMRVSQLGRVLVVTSSEDHQELAQELHKMQVADRAEGGTDKLQLVNSSNDGSFHLGTVLQNLIQKYQLDRLLVSGGTALPLITVEELDQYVSRLISQDNFVLTNNPQSGDIVLFHPGQIVDNLPPVASDNQLSNHLRYAAGLPQELMEKSTATLFDIDTPADLILYYMLTGEPSWFMEEYGWLFSRMKEKLTELTKVAATDYRELILLGRVSGNIISYINEHLYVRLRIFSEERGMKALGRISENKVESLMGQLLEDLGPDALFSYLEQIGDAGLLDTRVMFYHQGRGLPGTGEQADLDRFYSDLFMYEYVKDPVLKEFTKRAYESPLPVVMGGHSLVSGGIYALTSLIHG